MAATGTTGQRPVWRAPVLLLLVLLAAFTLARGLVGITNHPDFAGLTVGEWLLAFVHGLRFDLWAIALVAGGPALLLAMPVPIADRRWWRIGWGVPAFLGAAILVLGLAGDLCYYPHIHRHLGREVMIFLDDLAIAGSLIRSYGWAVALFVALVGAGGWWWWRLLRRPVSVHVTRRGWIWWLLAVTGSVLILRGAIWSKPIQVINAFEGTSLSGGQLTLNGPFTFLKALRGASPVSVEWMEPDLARELTATAISGERDHSPGDHPLDRRHTAPPTLPTGRPNVVLCLLESWNPAYLDAYRELEQQPALGLTPEFDRLAHQGWLFTRFYANGERSVNGIGALLAGIPTPPGVNLLGEGLELTRMEWLPRIARRHGWHSLFAQGSNRSSYRVDQICAVAGFADYYGAQDVPEVVDPAHAPTSERGNGAFDDEMFQFSLAKLDAAPKPVLGMCFTLATHGPFYLPDEARWRRDSTGARDGGWSNGYRDALRYSDWALGRFVDGIRARPWGRDTWIICVADHLSGWDLQGDGPDAHHRIPCLVLPPQADPRLVPLVASQVDLVPTIMDLCGWSGPWSGIGRSLLAPGSRNALCAHGDVTSFVEDDGWVMQSGPRLLQGHGPGTEERSRRHTALLQVLTRGLLLNEVLPPPR